MDVHYLSPDPALQPYIQHFVYSKIGISDKWTSTSMAPPGCSSLSITCEGKNVIIKENDNPEQRYSSVTFVGQTTQFKELRIFDCLKSFFVIFRPCGAYQLLGIDQDECADQCINITDLLGSSARFFIDEISDQTNSKDMAEVVNRYFLNRLKKKKVVDQSVHLANIVEEMKRNIQDLLLIDKICRSEGYSISKLERHMKKIVGMSPKKFQRIIRFNSVLQFIEKIDYPLNWSQIANRFGYYDQTHFIKEFKNFYGKTPSKRYSDDNFLSNIARREKITSNVKQNETNLPIS